MEKLIENALISAGIVYEVHDNKACGLDFYIPRDDLHIEVKQFYSPRVADQMARASNIIVAQGRPAVEKLARLIEQGYL